MNAQLETYEDIQAAYDEMMATDSEEMIDPVLMIGYVDNREENSRIYKEGIAREILIDENSMKRLDQIMIAKFFATMFATVAVGTLVVESCDWLVSLI